MDNIIKFNKLPDYYTSNYIGSGCNSDVFLIDNNEVFKKLNSPYIFENKINDLSKIKMRSFVFPKRLVYVKNKFVGYIMDYVDGVTLDKIKNIPIDKYIDETILFEYAIAALSVRKIYMVDFKDKNVIFTKDNTFKGIDTDLYFFVRNNKNPYKSNIRNFSTTILDPMMDVFEIEFNNKILNHNKELLIDGSYLASKFLIDVLKEMRKTIDADINNTTDVKNSLKLILK